MESRADTPKPVTGYHAFADHPGGCYACRYLGRRVGGSTVWCVKPQHEHVRAQAERGCVFWEREPGSEE